MSERLIKVALVQQNCGAERDDNMASSIDGIRDAAARGAKLIVLQELHTSHYFCQTEDAENFSLAEAIPGPTTDELGTIAVELGVVIVGSVFERRTAGIYHNTAVVVNANGSVAGSYRKMHIPDDPGYHEKYYFTPGDLGFTPVDTPAGRLGVLVCWDQWYPEAARLMALAGAEILIYPTAIGWDRDDDAAEQQRQYDSWRTVQRAHAIANGLPLVCCNRVGHEPDPSGKTTGIDFWGGSFIAGPQGEVLAAAPTDVPSVLVTEVDLARSEKVRQIWPFLRDRRVDAYAGLTERFRK